MRNKEVLLILILLPLLSFSAVLLSAQEGRGQARLNGVVVDQDGNPVEGATVTLESLIHNLTMTTTTDAKGAWSFLGLGKTVARITVTKEGYDPTIIPQLQISAIKNPEQEIKLIKKTATTGFDENDPRAVYEKGISLYEQGEYEEAIAMFERFLELQPDLYEARVNIGNCYVRLKEYDKAIKEFELVLEKLNQKYPDLTGNKMAASIYASLGELCMDQGKLEEARKYFDMSISLDRSDPALPYNIGEILFNSGKIDEAITYYKIAIEINPKWPKSYLKLGYCYLNKAEMETAINYFKKFVDLSPEDDPQVEIAKNIIKQLEK
ncbi:MAG TPA: tetratricopeptide repeat protein [Candidatus Saccharicenans sp.]|nr:tetratricopeptide repeat protein [Candidatus Saccharicenans sp.]HQM75320.1 tetratricopeptide repeat protein [Candidatus Saccharicenans sp.]